MDEARGNLCPECRGSGYHPILWGVDYWEEADWEEIACRSCNTTGTITTIPTEEETARNPHRLNEYMLSTERQYGRDVLTFAWPIQPR